MGIFRDEQQFAQYNFVHPLKLYLLRMSSAATTTATTPLIPQKRKASHDSAANADCHPARRKGSEAGSSQAEASEDTTTMAFRTILEGASSASSKNSHASKIPSSNKRKASLDINIIGSISISGGPLSKRKRKMSADSASFFRPRLMSTGSIDDAALGLIPLGSNGSLPSIEAKIPDANGNILPTSSALEHLDALGDDAASMGAIRDNFRDEVEAIRDNFKGEVDSHASSISGNHRLFVETLLMGSSKSSRQRDRFESWGGMSDISLAMGSESVQLNKSSDSIQLDKTPDPIQSNKASSDSIKSNKSSCKEGAITVTANAASLDVQIKLEAGPIKLEELEGKSIKVEESEVGLIKLEESEVGPIKLEESEVGPIKLEESNTLGVCDTDNPVPSKISLPRERLNSVASISVASLGEASLTNHPEAAECVSTDIQAFVAAAMATVGDQLAELAGVVETVAGSGASVNSNGIKDIKDDHSIMSNTSSLPDIYGKRERSLSMSSNPSIAVDYDAVAAAVDAAEAATGSLNLTHIGKMAPPSSSRSKKTRSSLPSDMDSSSLLPPIPPIPNLTTSGKSERDMEAIRARARAAAGYIPPANLKPGEVPPPQPVRKRPKPSTSHKGASQSYSSDHAYGMYHSTNKASSQKWDEMYECLLNFVEDRRRIETKSTPEHEKKNWEWDGNVPTTYKTKDGKALGRWINNQRSAKHKGNLKRDREVKLVSTGLKWSVLSTNSWQDMMEELKLYVKDKTKDGQEWDGNVPTNYKIKGNPDDENDGEEKNLGRWINRQRSLYQAGKLRKDREVELEKIGLKWSVLSTTSWQAMYETLLRYIEDRRKNDGDWDGNVPANYKTNDVPQKALGRWINRQRTAHQKAKLKKEFVDKLNAVGLKWSVHERRSASLHTLQTPIKSNTQTAIKSNIQSATKSNLQSSTKSTLQSVTKSTMQTPIKSAMQTPIKRNTQTPIKSNISTGPTPLKSNLTTTQKHIGASAAGLKKNDTPIVKTKSVSVISRQNTLAASNSKATARRIITSPVTLSTKNISRKNVKTPDSSVKDASAPSNNAPPNSNMKVVTKQKSNCQTTTPLSVTTKPKSNILTTTTPKESTEKILSTPVSKTKTTIGSDSFITPGITKSSSLLNKNDATPVKSSSAHIKSGSAPANCKKLDNKSTTKNIKSEGKTEAGKTKAQTKEHTIKSEIPHPDRIKSEPQLQSLSTTSNKSTTVKS